MNKLHKLMFAGALIFPVILQAQTIDDVLKQIEGNNKNLLAETQRLEAARVEFRTGMTLYDPQVSYDYMIGRPETAGNQTDVMFNQAFDFPTAYGNKRKVANLKSEQTEFERQLTRRQVLLDAKLICMRIIYGNKKKTELTRRLEQAQKFYRDYQTKFDNKDATILDLNKARLQLAGIQADLKLLDTELTANNQKLQEMNGGITIQLTDVVYPMSIIPEDFEAMFQRIEESDPIFKFYSKQKEIGDAQVSLSKSLWLPKVEAGYHYQGILGQKFSGAHIGLNIPLWEKRNTVNHVL
jgi:cobalt-zinc-cadmium efflux system outer membrane protein